MPLGDFQRALARMTLDPRLAADVRARGPDALHGYELTEREAQRLQAAARQDGMSLNCSLARANRFASIHDAFPMTCTLLGQRLRELLDDLWSQRCPDNYQLAGEEAGFARRVERAVEQGEVGGEYLEEVFQFEQICWNLAMRLRVQDAPTIETQTNSVRFSHDPGTLFDLLSQGAVPLPGLPRGDYLITVRVKDGDLVAEWDVAERA